MKENEEPKNEYAKCLVQASTKLPPQMFESVSVGNERRSGKVQDALRQIQENDCVEEIQKTKVRQD